MSLLLRCSHIVDGVGTSLPQHGLLIEGERIARLAPIAEFDGYSGEDLSLDDCTLLPGLIDCHVHLCFDAEPNPGEATDKMRPGAIAVRALANAQTSLRGGITAIRDCGGKDYLEFAARDACNRGQFQGPTIRASGRMICMTGGHGNRFGRVADGVDEVVRAVREQVHAGSDLVKIMATGGVMTPGVDPEDAHYSAEELAAGIAEGHRFHKPCASHAQGTEGILNAVRGGIDSIEHGIFLSEKCIAVSLGSDELLVGVRVPRRGAALRWACHKICVKAGEFARAFVVAMEDKTSGERRAVVAAIERVPLVLEGDDTYIDGPKGAELFLAERLPSLAPIPRRLHAVALVRALRALDSQGQGG